jgi:hypothetical protein
MVRTLRGALTAGGEGGRCVGITSSLAHAKINKSVPAWEDRAEQCAYNNANQSVDMPARRARNPDRSPRPGARSGTDGARVSYLRLLDAGR